MSQKPMPRRRSAAKSAGLNAICAWSQDGFGAADLQRCAIAGEGMALERVSRETENFQGAAKCKMG